MTFQTQWVTTEMLYKRQIHHLIGIDQSFRTESLGESVSLE